MTMNQQDHNGARRQWRADQIVQWIQQAGYTVFTSRSERLVVYTATNDQLRRSGVGTSDQGDELMAAITLAGTLRMDLPLHLQPLITEQAITDR